MNKKYLDKLLDKYDAVISEGLYNELLNPPSMPFQFSFSSEPLVFTLIRAMDEIGSKETRALSALIHGYFDDTGLRSLSQIKDKARKGADALGIKHTLGYEFIARQYGYKTWNALIHSGNFTE